jgi:hypothetical protein
MADLALALILSVSSKEAPVYAPTRSLDRSRFVSNLLGALSVRIVDNGTVTELQ